MAFAQKTWKDRVSEFINRRTLTKDDGTRELVTVERSEGTISQEGDAFSAKNMNDLEQRIAGAFSNFVATDGTEFRFGKNEKGEYGYIVEQDGADTVIPFSGKYKNQIVGALQNTNLELTEESSWEEIVKGIYSLFPEQLDVLAYLGIQNLSISGSTRDGAGKWHYKSSGKFDITHFNTLTYVLSLNSSSSDGYANCHLFYEGGSLEITSGSKAIDVSGCTGEAYFRVGQSQVYHSTGDYTSGGSASLTSAKLHV